jgi:hypothetical protein
MAQTAINAQIGLFVGKILLAAAAFLVFEDIWTMMRGGKSVIGDLITQTTGLKRPADLVNASFEKWAINLHNAAQYMKEIYRWFPVTALPTRVIEYFATGRSGFDVGWRPNILKPKGDEDARIQNVQADAAVQKGDLQAFQNAMSGSGMDNGQIRQAFDMQRKAALFTGRARPKSEDIGEGLVEGIAYTPAGPRINNARGASGVHNGRGPIQATFNMTFGDGDPATTERAVYKALGTWHREEAAALAEQSGPQEEGGE